VARHQALDNRLEGRSRPAIEFRFGLAIDL
jgi:hypothetical protein